MDGGPRSPWTTGVKNVKQHSVTTRLKIMMMTFMIELKGNQRSNVVNDVLWLLNLVKRITDVRLG